MNIEDVIAIVRRCAPEMREYTFDQKAHLEGGPGNPIVLRLYGPNRSPLPDEVLDRVREGLREAPDRSPLLAFRVTTACEMCESAPGFCPRHDQAPIVAGHRVEPNR